MTHQRLLGWLLACMLLNPLAAGYLAAADQFKMITLQYRFAQDILPMIEPMVGPTGSVRAIDNHLFVSTSPDRLAQIEAIISQLDIARKNVRIMVSHASEAEAERRGIDVTGRGRVGNAEIMTTRDARDGINIDLQDRDSVYSSMGNEFLTVLDGERAFIRVGQSVPYTQQWVYLTSRYINIQQTIEFQDITTGFAVRPRYIGEQVELEITPRIARLNQTGFIDFEELSTVVIVKPGEWFDLGGNMQNRDDVSREILSISRGGNRQKSNLKIRVD
jgi:type II secretory pathway component GspD/PulD (secretin)